MGATVESACLGQNGGVYHLRRWPVCSFPGVKSTWTGKLRAQKELSVLDLSLFLSLPAPGATKAGDYSVIEVFQEVTRK